MKDKVKIIKSHLFIFCVNIFDMNGEINSKIIAWVYYEKIK